MSDAAADQLFLGRQPILDREQRLHAYELLFRSGSRNFAEVTDGVQATATVIANAFSELTDPAELRRRFEADMALKEKLYGIRYPIDEDFMAALEHGLPPSAGIALGIDRLVMLATGAEHIEDVLWAPVSGPEGR